MHLCKHLRQDVSSALQETPYLLIGRQTSMAADGQHHCSSQTADQGRYAFFCPVGIRAAASQQHRKGIGQAKVVHSIYRSTAKACKKDPRS